MKFQIEVRDKGGMPWIEEYNEDVTDPEKWAHETIDRFNNSLRPGETPREVVSVKIMDQDAPIENHNWQKQNLVTVSYRGQLFDIMRCGRCDITGKRHGLNQPVKLDSQYQAKAFQRCDTSLALQAKRQARAALKLAEGETS